jgi:16S rRNA (cytidine1402-2'-O)-methyltransferase
LEQVAELPYTLIFLEAPHRLLDALQDLLRVLGDRPVAVARELTKLHEEIFRGSLSEALTYFQEQGPRGELTLVVAGKPEEQEQWAETRMRAAIAEAQARGESAAQIAGKLAAQSGWPRRTVYRMVTDQGRHQDESG